jgi:vancomycin resistance protein YoaR
MTIKAALFNQQVPYVTLDESSRKIDKVLNNNTTNYLGSSVNRKVYIATSG